MRVVEAFAPAKINLALHVTGRKADGYHLIDSIVAFADIGDLVRVTQLGGGPSTPMLEANGPFAEELGPMGDNLILAAARLLGRSTGQGELGSLHFHLEKNLPVAGGIGGGSADAAAALRALAKLWALSPDCDLAETGLALGADIPMCLHSTMARVRGTGERIDSLASRAAFDAVLVNPGVALETPKVFAALKEFENPPIEIDDLTDAEALRRMRNDLQEPAIGIVPAIAETIDVIAAQPGCRLARMSGSGATCFGLFGDAAEAENASRAIGAALPGAWCKATVLGSPDITVRQTGEIER